VFDIDLNGRLLDLFASQTRELALLVLDSSGKIVRWAGGARDIFGYGEPEVVGRHLDFLLPLHDQERGGWSRELQEALARGERVETCWLLRRDRTLVCIDSVLTPLRDIEGRLAGYTKVMRCSAAPAAEADARGRQESPPLDATVGSDVVAVIAHELRNVIGPLSSVAQLLQLKSEGGNLEQPAEIIRRQAGFVAHLVEELLESTRIDHDTVRLSVAETDLAIVVAQALESCDERLTARGQSVLVAIAQPIVLKVDPTRLRQVLINLISNSSKYSRDNARIWVKGGLENGHAVIRVVDQGCGIRADFLPHVFEKFSRAEERRTCGPELDGLGLGLSIAKTIVKMHGGSIEVRSDGDGKGCECVVRLPLEAKAAASA
jgi:PAS domain S-box-containing protein